MIFKTHIILYVNNQSKSCDFYKNVLNLEPVLNVPGMTEFELSENTILGLMPVEGIKRLLGEKLPEVFEGNKNVKSELYLYVDEPETYHKRALKFGAIELSKFESRNWGDKAAYSVDFDGNVIAFAIKE